MTGYGRLWKEIASDGLRAGAVVRRVLPHLTHDVHVGQARPSQHRFLEMRLLGPIGIVPQRSPASKGLDVRVVLESPERAVIHLKEATVSNTSQFEDLVSDLLATLDSDPSPGAAGRIVERIIAWQDFFARRSTPMSSESAAGLFAELTILNDVMIPGSGAAAAVTHWTGPDPALQDFQFPEAAIEVKSFRGIGAGRLSISSERQLDGVGSARLIVGYVELDERSDGTGATLFDLINTSRMLARSSPSAFTELGDKLLKAGWRDSYEKERTERYITRKVEFFIVDGDFPRLTSEMLPVGIGHVRYEIDRSAIQPFLIDRSRLDRIIGFIDA